MGKDAEYPILHLDSGEAWREWLEANHATSSGVWLRIARKGADLSSPTREEALDAALCYGWIDGQARSEGETSWLQKFTPRGKRSTWSKRNREKVERLIAAGLMRPAGMREVEAARADGRWDRAYDSPATASIPPDLEAALEQSPRAKEFFASLNSINRYAILHRIQTAVKPETRARRIEKLVAMLERGEKLY
ncbi:MAG TPA: YdeI/OmpD-associated family protein [Longimicrobiaceae bacterium]